MTSKQLINTNSMDSFRAKLIEVVNTGIDNSLTVDNIKFEVAQMRAELDAFGLTPEQVVTINSLLDLIAQAEETDAIEAVVAQLASKANVDDLNALQLQVNAMPTRQDLDLKANQSALDLKANKTDLDTKQDILTAGANVDITNNVISVVAPDGDGDTVEFADISGAPTDNAGLAATFTTIDTKIAAKQNKLTAGTGLTLTGDVISANTTTSVESLDNAYGKANYSADFDFNNVKWSQQLTRADITGYQTLKFRSAYLAAGGVSNGPHGYTDYSGSMSVLSDYYDSTTAKGSQILIEPSVGGLYHRTHYYGGWRAWTSMFPTADATAVTDKAIALGDGAGTLDYTRMRHEQWAPNASQYSLNGFITVTTESTAAITTAVAIDAVANYNKLAAYAGKPFRTKVWNTSTGEDVGMIIGDKTGVNFKSFKVMPVGEYSFSLLMTIVA